MQVTPAHRIPLVTSWTSCENMKFDGNKMMETFGGCRRWSPPKKVQPPPQKSSFSANEQDKDRGTGLEESACLRWKQPQRVRFLSK